MNICIIAYPAFNIKFDPDSVKDGLSGSEEAIVYLANEFCNIGHKVTVFGNPPSDKWRNHNPSYQSFLTDLLPLMFLMQKKFDVVILWRIPRADLFQTIGKCVYFWPHDVPDAFVMSPTDGLAIHKTFWLSQYQAKLWHAKFREHSNSGLAFVKPYGNGVCLDQFIMPRSCTNPYSCIYASCYSRGLRHLLNIWPKIKVQFPQASLDVYYGVPEFAPPEIQELQRKCHAMEGLDVYEHGKIGHQELAQRFLSCSIWAYPCDFPETFCITAVKAQLAGCIPVTTNYAALSETVEFGYQIAANEIETLYEQQLIKAMLEIDTWTAERRETMQNEMKKHSWREVAKMWDEELRSSAK